MKVKRNKQKGFTLMELLAVIAIMAIIGNVVISLFISSQKTFIVSNNENIVQDEGRMIVEFLENDMKVGKGKTATAGTGAITIGATSYSCAFALGKTVTPVFVYEIKEADPSGAMIDVVYAYVKVDKQLIKAKVNAGTLVKVGTLTEHLKSITVSSTKPYEVEFILQAVGTENKYNLTVTPRNG